MTTNPLLATLIPLVADLSRDLPEDERYRRLLQALRDLLPCDATALLRLDGEYLIPLAVDGLSPDTLGRRFRVGEHPRLEALLERRGPTRFPADCGLPDPYDGLVEGLHGHLEIHDCLGCPLYLDDQPWGLLTLDTLDPSRFASADLDTLEAFASLAAATVKASERMRDLTRRAEDEHQRAEAYLEAAGERPREMIGQSAAHKALLEEIRLVGNSDLSVLITGETGVGKELVAQSIHRHSMRSGKPMISLNCAALPETLVESELFGHVRGAFSGAVNERRGKFELADGGGLFLDEVGELPLAVQAKLLRVLQSGQLQRVGSDREHRVDVRLIAATNRDLAEEVRAGRFRADLYHRLSVYPLRVPPLRARPRYPPAGRLLPRGKPTAPGTAQPAPGPRGPGRAPRLSLAGQRARTRAPGRPRLAQGPRPQSGAVADRHPASAGSRPARGNPAPPRSVVEPRPPRQRPVTRCARPPTPTNAT